jgi:hypothetical protein
MTNEEYLVKILESQTLAPDGEEVKALRQHRDDVESLLLAEFEKSNPTIRYGGSKAKGTMIKECYDLDVICYFGSGDTGAGETLADIYKNSRTALQKAYLVEEKSSALRLRSNEMTTYRTDFHIDVIPGRFTDGTRSDAFLYISSGEKERLKTNLDVHIKYVRDSGFTDPIRLVKLWGVRQGLRVRSFVLELLVIKILDGSVSRKLEGQLGAVLKFMRDHKDGLCVEDPANPKGNDLSSCLDDSVRDALQSAAKQTLASVEYTGWESVFGAAQSASRSERVAAIRTAAASISSPARPWSK